MILCLLMRPLCLIRINGNLIHYFWLQIEAKNCRRRLGAALLTLQEMGSCTCPVMGYSSTMGFFELWTTTYRSATLSTDRTKGVVHRLGNVPLRLGV